MASNRGAESRKSKVDDEGNDKHGKRKEEHTIPDYFAEHYYYQSRYNFPTMLTAPIDAYTLNGAYNWKHDSIVFKDNTSKSHSQEVSGKSAARKDHEKRLRQIQFYVLALIGLTVILCLAFGLGFGLGYPDNNAIETSRLESEDPNKVPDVTIRVVVMDLRWDERMADTSSQSFKTNAGIIERSMDLYFGNSQIAEFYSYAVVSQLWWWDDSVGCNAQIYLTPLTANTSEEIRDTYISFRNGSDVNVIVKYLRMGEEASKSMSLQHRVLFKFDTLQIISTAVTTTTMSTVGQTSSSVPSTTPNSESNTTASTSASNTAVSTSVSNTTPNSVSNTTLTSVSNTTISSSGTTSVNETVATTLSSGTLKTTSTIFTTINITASTNGTTQTISGMVSETVGTTPSTRTISTSTMSSETETTPADDTGGSIDALFYIEDGKPKGNFDDKNSQEYLKALALIEEEIRQSYHDAGEGDNLETVIPEGFWLNNYIIEVVLTWKDIHAINLTSLQEKFTLYHEARVQNNKSSISLKIYSFNIKLKDDCPYTFSDACSELLLLLNTTGHSQINLCGNYTELIQCLYTTYQSKGLSLCNKTTLDQHLKYYNSLILFIYGANIVLCDINNNKIVIDLAVLAQFTLHSVEWNDTLKDKTSSQFKYLSDKVINVFNQLNLNITVLEIVDFNREGETLTASAIMNIVSYVNIDITSLIKQLQLNLQLQQQSSDMAFLELVSAEWVKDLTAVLKQTELLIWYNSKWNSVCQWLFPASAVDIVCHQLGYTYGFSYQGEFKENALELSNLTCNDSATKSSLKDCVNMFSSIAMTDCVVTKMNCFNTLIHYELVGGDETTYGYVKVTLDNKDGLLCSSGTPHSDAMAAYLCRDIDSKFYGGSNLQTDTLQKPAELDVWTVEANCYRPETDSTFSDCIQSGWDFLLNVTYYSISTMEDTEKPPYIPDSSTCPLSGTTQSPVKMPDNVIFDSCLVTVQCHTEPVAIYQGLFSSLGYIFATTSSVPKFFCRDIFTDQEAAAACKTIGYNKGGKSLQFNPIPWFDSNKREYSSYTYKCSENVTIQECNKTEIDLVIQQCSGPGVVKCVDNVTENKDWNLKIDNDGYTLLLYYNGQWGTVCETSSGRVWSTKETTVVCRELGYSYGVRRALHLLPTKSLPHLITNVTCPDNAVKLSDCTYNEVHDDSCTNSYAVEVFCYNSSDVANLKLVGGPELNSGLVKVTWQNVDGYLCAWSLKDTVATVMCRSFGFISGVQDTSTNFTDPHLQYIWRTDFNGQCNENEISVETCRSASWVKYSASLSEIERSCVCDESYTALYCYGKVKVSSELRKSYGPLLIYMGNDYYSICYKDLDQNAANAACREVTRHNTSNAVILYPGTFLLGDLSKSVRFNCSEEAISVSDCATFLNGDIFDCLGASVLCYDGLKKPGLSPENATEWRIEDSIVQIKVYDVWGMICSYGWTNTEAAVLCKTISSEYTVAFAKDNIRMSTLPMWLGSVLCGTNATNINMCTRTTLLETIDYCQLGGAATTFCFRGEIDVPKFTLADAQETTLYIKGHTAVTRNNLIGYFCPLDKNVVEQNADALCNIMGYFGGQIDYGFTWSVVISSLTTMNEVLQEKIIQNEHPLIWNGSYDCDWNIPQCFLTGNYTHKTYEDFDNSVSDTSLEKCNSLVPDVLCFKTRVRLQNAELSEGFLLVKREDGWSGICADNFTSYLGDKFCSEAGYQSGNYTAASASDAGLVAGFGDVICVDNAKFEDCIFRDLTLDCDNIVYISCYDFICVGNCTRNGNTTINP